MAQHPTYLLAEGAVELERLQLQARVWEPQTEAWLDTLGIAPGAACIDLGCGALGVLGPLARRVGPEGRVLGIDRDAKQLAAARTFVEQSGLTNVMVEDQDAFATGLPDASFDLVHVRFLLAPVGRADELLQEAKRLLRPGGLLAVQEPDSAAWSYTPENPGFTALKNAILTAFQRGGGDFDAGRRTPALLRRHGFVDIAVRGAVVTLTNGHPYLRLPVQFATSLKERILSEGLMTESALADAVAACEAAAVDPETVMTSFVVTQVSGRKAPAGGVIHSRSGGVP